MKWHKLESDEALGELIKQSHNAPQIIFKHSSRCSMSSVALNSIQPGRQGLNYYIVDVIAKRKISDNIEERFDVIHQSPQLLVIYRGRSIFDTSHFGITADVVEDQLNSLEEV